MDGFDTITMSYLAAPMQLSNVTAPDALDAPMLPLDNLDRHSNFDAETFAGYAPCDGPHHSKTMLIRLPQERGCDLHSPPPSAPAAGPLAKFY